MAHVDQLIISDLEARCRIGVYDWEQQTPQPIWIDLELSIDAQRAAGRDEVKDAVDYSRLVTAVRAQVESSSYRLLETAAEAIAELVLSAFPTVRVLVRLKKRALPGIGYAAVEIIRRRTQRLKDGSRAASTTALRA